jgi:hypothetical protein
VTATSLSLLTSIVGDALALVGVIVAILGITVAVRISRRNGELRIPFTRPEDPPTRKGSVFIVWFFLGALAALVLRGYRLRR